MARGIEQVFAQRLRAIREREKPIVSQAELARRMTELGFPMDRLTILKIERAGDARRKGQPRRVTIEELIGFSIALGVSPLELLVPENEERFSGPPAARYAPKPELRVKLAKGLELSDLFLFDWLRGDSPLRKEDVRTFNERRTLPTWGGDQHVEILAELNLLGELNDNEREALVAAIEARHERISRLLRDRIELAPDEPEDSYLRKRERELARLQQLLETTPKRQRRKK